MTPDNRYGNTFLIVCMMILASLLVAVVDHYRRDAGFMLRTENNITAVITGAMR